MGSLIKKLNKNPFRLRSYISTHGKNPNTLTKTQKSFIIWNAERLGISTEESQKRFFVSWSAVNGGHSGPDYRLFSDVSYKLFQVFFNDTGDEIYSAYGHHGYMHFLRMLSYSEPQWSDDNVVIQYLGKYSHVDILDYGCGLAQRSRSLADALKDKGIVSRLFLVDIPTIRKEFLLWLGLQSGIETVFLDCTVSMPMPELPGCDICIAKDFFEHVYEPVKYFEKINMALRKNGLLMADFSDQKREFMHVSPNLKPLRDRIHELNYEVIEENYVCRKTF
jgi:SAM-dependent methyltransferase